MNKKQKKMLRRILIAAALMIVLHFAVEAYGDTVHEPVWFLLYLIPYLTVGYDILLKAGKGIKNRQVFDEIDIGTFRENIRKVAQTSSFADNVEMFQIADTLHIMR